MDDRQKEQLQHQNSKTMELKTLVRAHSVDTGLLTEAGSFSEQIPTEETEFSSTDISMNANKTAELCGESDAKCAVTRAVSICSPRPVEIDQPKPLCALLPASTVYEASQSFTSVSRSQDSLRTKTHTEAGGEVLLACLFCHPLDCLVATVRGCNQCLWSLCSAACGCEATTVQPLVDITHRGDLCSCLGAPCCMCDCPICDVCLQATECLDLAMEISQMLYH